MKFFDVPNFLDISVRYQVDDVVYWASLLETLCDKAIPEGDLYKIAYRIENVDLTKKYEGLLRAAAGAAMSGGHSMLSEFYLKIAEKVKDGQSILKLPGRTGKACCVEDVLHDIQVRSGYPKPDYKLLRHLMRAGDVEKIGYAIELLSGYYEVDEEELDLLLEIAKANDTDSETLQYWITEYKDLPEALWCAVESNDLEDFLRRHDGQILSMLDALEEVLVDAYNRELAGVVKILVRYDYKLCDCCERLAGWWFMLFIHAVSLRDRSVLIKYCRRMFFVSEYLDSTSGYWGSVYEELLEWFDSLDSITNDDSLIYDALFTDYSIKQAVWNRRITDEILLRAALQNVKENDDEKSSRRRF